ncbi:heavy metal translocating P-type ATPase [Candidatus Saccharibacteria bacterium]|nr:heavy metal translocating P-type ATPase [Candidatus Saccharibacteria bacterium]
MLKKIAKFFVEYKQFGLVLLSLLVAGLLYIFNQHTLANWLLAIAAIINLIPLVWGMIQDLRIGTYGVDILAATAILASVLYGEFLTAMVIVLMLTGGESLEDYAEKRAKTELTDLLKRAPTKAHLIKGGKEKDIKVGEVQTGDKLAIRPGEVVPVDALILDGTASFDESSITGESLPVTKQVGDQILSGSINMDGALKVRALKTAENSQYQQIVQLVKTATSSKSPFVRVADRYSIPFTLFAFTVAIGAWAISGDSLRFLQVLVVATPCPLILAAPIALISGMSRAAKNGIIAKKSSALEKLAEVKTIGFDKTGTLTKGQPVVSSITSYGKFTKDDVIRYAATLENNSNHILATAITSEASKRKLKPTKAKHISEIAGLGLKANVSGRPILVGRLSLMEKENISLPSNFNKSQIKSTAALVAIDGQLAGQINFEDEIRTETKPTLKLLKNLGIKHLLMVTGDNNKTAQAIANKLGITDIVSEALPADKIQAIEDVEHRPVAFVGDGVNDAPVLATADVGIALGAKGSTAASESADIVIMVDDISKVETAVHISKRTLYIAKQSIFIGIGLSVILMLIFATGKFKPVYGAAIQEVVDVVVIFNALRAHGTWKKSKRLGPNKLTAKAA